MLSNVKSQWTPSQLLNYRSICIIKFFKIKIISWEYPTCALNPPVDPCNFSYSSTTHGILSMNDISLEIPRGFLSYKWIYHYLCLIILWFILSLLFFLHYHFEKVKMKLFHWPTGQKGEEKVRWSIMIHKLLRIIFIIFQNYISNIWKTVS